MCELDQFIVLSVELIDAFFSMIGTINLRVVTTDGIMFTELNFVPLPFFETFKTF